MSAFNAEVLSLLGVGLVVASLRVGVRVCRVGSRRLSPDDYLAGLASVCYIIETALAHYAVNKANGLTNSFTTEGERAELQPSSVEYESRELGSKIQLGSWVSSSVLLWSTKAAVCSLYLRLARGHHRGYCLPAYIGFGFIATSWLAATLNLFLSCRPLRHMWQVYSDPGAQCQPASSPALLWTYMGLDVATYVYLMAMPIPMLFKAALPTWQKVITVVLLCCGLCVTTAAILRAVVASTFEDVQQSRLWAMREEFAALFTANMAILLPSIAQWAIARRSSSNHATNPVSAFDDWHSTNMRFNDSEETMVGTLYVRDKADLDRRPSSGDDSDGRIQRRVDVCVMGEDERAPGRSGNYTGVWSGYKGGRAVPQTRSRYFGDDVPQRALVRM